LGHYFSLLVLKKNNKKGLFLGGKKVVNLNQQTTFSQPILEPTFSQPPNVEQTTSLVNLGASQPVTNFPSSTFSSSEDVIEKIDLLNESVELFEKENALTDLEKKRKNNCENLTNKKTKVDNFGDEKPEVGKKKIETRRFATQKLRFRYYHKMYENSNRELGRITRGSSVFVM